MEQSPILFLGSAFVFAEDASRAVASVSPSTDLAQLDVLGNIPDDIGLSITIGTPTLRPTTSWIDRPSTIATGAATC